MQNKKVAPQVTGFLSLEHIPFYASQDGLSNYLYSQYMIYYQHIIGCRHNTYILADFISPNLVVARLRRASTKRRRRGRDSNSRILADRWFSKPLHSTTMRPLLIKIEPIERIGIIAKVRFVDYFAFTRIKKNSVGLSPSARWVCKTLP